MASYLTCGQAAKQLKVSISTLKRWVCDPELGMAEFRNGNGWRLFSEEDMGNLRDYKKRLKRAGKRYSDITLLPVQPKKRRQSRPQESKLEAIA
jgi:excisionase family DNA binding protein